MPPTMLDLVRAMITRVLNEGNLPAQDHGRYIEVIADGRKWRVTVEEEV